MTFRARDGQGAQALEFNQLIDQLLGRGVVAGGSVTQTNQGAHVVQIESTAVYINDERIDVPQQTRNLAGYIADKPRKVLLYVSTDGEVAVAPGDPEEPRPRGEHRFDTYRPAPPDLSHMDAVVLAEVWLSPRDKQTTEADILDRGFDSNLKMYSASGSVVSFDKIIDGAGVEHDGELADAVNVPTEDNIRTIIDEDPDHGWDASHNYFSGSHDDLTDVEEDNHHPPYQDEEAREAVRGEVDAAELDGASGAAGQHLTWTGSDVRWLDPPSGQADVVSSGVITHTGGSSTTVLLSGITTDQTAQFEVGFGISDEPTWSANYGYSADVSRQWDDSAEEVDLEVTLTWTTDPGSGNDLDIRYTAWDTHPALVDSYYSDTDARQALDGADIAPRSVRVGESMNPPVYDELGQITDPEFGDEVVISGAGDDTFGEYIYDGQEWSGPLGTSVSMLSDLAINTAKDWNGHRIVNVGAPTASTDVARPQEIQNHANDENAHHSPTTSSDIDHAEMSNVQPNQHHAPPSSDDIVASAAGRVFSLSLTGASVPSGEYLRDYIYLDSGEELSLVRAEFFDENGNTPSGLTLELAERGSTSPIYSQSSKLQRRSVDNALATVSGEGEYEARIFNDTSRTRAVSGVVGYIL